MAGFVNITPLTIGADGSSTTQSTTQAAINALAQSATAAVNGLTGGRGLPQILAQSAVPASVTGTLSETTLATIAIPAGAMGVNGQLRITTLWTFTTSANNKTVQARLGGTSIGLAAMTANSGLQHQIILRNRGAANSQIAFANGQASFAVTSAAMVIGSIDTSVAQNLTLTGMLANTGETITLEAYTVEILNP